MDTEILDLNELDDREFAELAKSDCFLREPDAHSELLRNEENLDRFHVALRSLATSLHNQLTTYKESLETGARVRDEDWRLRTSRLKRVVEVRLVEVKGLVKDRNIRRNEEQRGDGSYARASKDEVFTSLRRMRSCRHLSCRSICRQPLVT